MTPTLARLDREIETMYRNALYGLIIQLSVKQFDLFKKVNPDWRKMPLEKVRSAINLCDRTIANNIANPSRVDGVLSFDIP